MREALPKLKGFTLIELLVVIAVIGLLSSIVLASLNTARDKGRDANRLSSLVNVRTALELYRSLNPGYPSTSSTWRSECSNWGSYGTTGSNGWIPNLAPTYMGTLPTDPSMVTASNENCYLYRSDGVHYKMLDLNLQNTDVETQPNFMDPQRNYGLSRPAGCTGTSGNKTWAIWSDDASMCW